MSDRVDNIRRSEGEPIGRMSALAHETIKSIEEGDETKEMKAIVVLLADDGDEGQDVGMATSNFDGDSDLLDSLLALSEAVVKHHGGELKVIMPEMN